MAEIKMYTKTWCPFCVRAKNLLEGKNQTVKEINVEHMDGGFEKLKAQTGMRTVPQIFINDKLVGGYQELAALDASGELDKLLS